MDVTTIFRPPIATPTVVDGNVFFRQGGDQLNSGHRGTEDIQPETTMSACTIVAPGACQLWVETIIVDKIVHEQCFHDNTVSAATLGMYTQYYYQQYIPG